ncbi:hypothetical protein TKK_0015281 [Trichogramma kaykai]|uniref:Uncharacterized protein n=1 Tax=Trichogramma kaykai TaxID=54128 RepID=A0ABD2WAZ5_9HYME
MSSTNEGTSTRLSNCDTLKQKACSTMSKEIWKRDCQCAALRTSWLPGIVTCPRQSRSRMPLIQVPEFSGRREDWESFRDLFKVLIDRDEHLSDVERMYFLKTLVKCEASAALSTLSMTGDNYITAWNLLENRYENHRLLVQDHLSALQALKTIREDSVKSL